MTFPLPDTGATPPPPDMGEPVTYPQQPAYPAAPAQPAPQPPAPTPQPPGPPAPPPVPQPPAPAPQPMPPVPPVPQFVAPPIPPQQPAPQTPPAPPAPAGNSPQSPPPATGDEPNGFPANTPLAEMTQPQQLAYWKHQSRKHEQRVREMSDYDQLKQQSDEYQRWVASQQTEHQRAVEDARRQGRDQALAEAGGQLVDQWVRAAAAGRLPQESVNALLLGLDRKAFLNAQGGVDTDRVYQFVSTLAPQPAATPVPGAVPGQQPQPVAPQTQQVTPQFAAPPGGPDFGQGQPPAPRANGLAAGRAIAQQRFGVKPQTAAQPTQ